MERKLSAEIEYFVECQVKKIKQFLEKNKYTLILLVGYSFITYGYEITNWTLTIDEEIHSYKDKTTFAKGWIGDGRWGLGILKLILPSHKVLPYFNGILAVIILIMCALMLGYIVQKYISHKVVMTTVSVIFLTVPLHSYYLMFDTFSVEILVGFMSAIMSGYFCTEAGIKKSKVQEVIAIILLTFSVGIYQSYFLVYACVVCMIIILNLACDSRNTSGMKGVKGYYFLIIRSILTLGISMVIYAVINHFLQSIFGRSNYIDGYFRWAYVDKSVCIEQMKTYLRLLFTRPEELFVGGRLLSICYLIYLVHFALLLFKMKGRRILIILTYMGLSLSMCFQYILFAGATPIRSQQVLSIYICFAFVLLSLIFGEKIWRNTICLLSCLLALYQASAVVELFYSENIRQKQDEDLLNRIVVEIEELNLGEEPDYPVVFVGKHNWNGKHKIVTEQFDLSMFNTGQIGRLYVWMNVLGYNYLQPSEEQQYRAEEIAQDMPVWPYAGSVALVEDIIIVNLGTDD